MKNKKANPSLYGKIDRKALAKRRVEAIELYRTGWTQYRIAKHIGVSFEAVSNWVEAYQGNGLEGLQSIGKSGPKPVFAEGDELKDKIIISQKSNLPVMQKEMKPKQTILARLFKLISN